METATALPVIRPRSVKAASRLSDLSYGLGQIYCGHLVRGLVIYVAGMTTLVAMIMLVALLKGRFITALVAGGVPAIGLWLWAKFDARRLARQAPADYALKEYNRWHVYAMLAFLVVPIAVCGAFFIRDAAYEAFQVASDRMAPTLQKGQRVIANKTIYEVEPMQRGDVVIIRSPGKQRISLVQRLVALPGDTVEADGPFLRVNGTSVARAGAAPATTPSTRPSTSPSTIRTLPPGQGYFISDNTASELRDLGEAPLGNVVGRVEFVYWPRPARVK